MEVVALAVGILIGFFSGIIAYGLKFKNILAGTLIIDKSNSSEYPDIYLDQIEEPASLEKRQFVLMGIKVVNVSSHK